MTHQEFFTTTNKHTITAHPDASLQAPVLKDGMDFTLFSSTTCKVETPYRFSCEPSHHWENSIQSIAKD